ncbi:MAG: DNA translocase FtsK 4TM domain-containing protein [Chlamydiota bacterium]
MAEKKPSPIAHPEIKGLLILAASLFLFLAFFSFVRGAPESNWLGIVGYGIAIGWLYTFGLCSYLVACWIGWIGWKLLVATKPPVLGAKTLYFSLFIISLSFLLNVLAENYSLTHPFIRAHTFSESSLIPLPFPHRVFRCNLGGVPLYYLYRDLPTFNLQHMLSDVGVSITFSLTALMSLILFTDTQLLSIFRTIKSFTLGSKNFIVKVCRDLKPLPAAFKPKGPLFPKIQPKVKPLSADLELPQTQSPTEEPAPQEQVEQDDLKISTHLEYPSAKSSGQKLRSGTKPYRGAFKRYRIPSLHLLTNAKKIDQPTLKKDLRRQAEVLEATLLSFGIKAKVGQIHCGPTITLFEVHPPVGVKVQKIKVLANDIALNLQAKSIRIIAPIPGKAAVGIEVPSLYPQEVNFKEMLGEYQRQRKQLHIPILLGQTVTGEHVFCDLTKMPHCIIAGATGSGKSVCINSIVMSVLMTARPDEIQLLLIDPKKVELSSYAQLPHMIAPVITEAAGAYAALNWLVKEMQYRYEVLKQLKLRNITAFNHRKIRPAQEAELPIDIPEKMPYIVAIIDEFADLMMVSGSDLETPIARIAQMARAVGIHLILATQRPSREVITGIIKANFPSRIAFKVASRVNSQIILDEIGAENLLGNGDVLFLPPGSAQLKRAQGVYIRDSDINSVIQFIENQAPPQYLIPSFDQMAQDALDAEAEAEPESPLYQRAYDTVIEAQRASTTFLQRRLKIGYPTAAALMDELQKKGVVGPQEGSRPRRVLVKLNE